MIKPRLIYLIPPLLGAFAVIGVGVPSVRAAVSDSGTTKATYRYIEIGGVSQKQLANGHPGEGWIEFFGARSNGKIALLVHLEKAATGSVATAQVYQGSDLKNFTFHTGVPIVPSNLKPSIVMNAVGGYWINSNDTPNYNLNVKVYGPIYAMWGFPSYSGQISKGELEATIKVRSSASGLPQWDFRSLVPQLPGEGVLRSNYAQTEPGSPTALPIDSGVDPSWPYVATSGGYEQPIGAIAPPIVVDWKTGHITYFSELVTVRNQSNSYDFYSLTPIVAGRVNRPDFESPWGLYNLSSNPQSLPNLIIRTNHYPSGDPWAAPQPGIPLNTAPTESVRYSWADHPGNQQFDFSVNVLGNVPYTTREKILGGTTQVVAPSYSAYPMWVIGHNWPVATFVATNGHSYNTSEGIYEWNPASFGANYTNGWSSTPNLQAFRTITRYFRGEYRLGTNQKPYLYISPIDNRLHLLWANGGVWNLGGGKSIVEGNLAGGKYIDSWELRKAQAHSRSAGGSDVLLQGVYHIGDFTFSTGATGIQVLQSATPQSLLQVLPPTGKRSWASFRDQMSRYSGKSPYNLVGWLSGMPGVLVSVPSLHITQVFANPNTISLVLHGTQNVASTGTGVGLPLPKGPGDYVLSYKKGSGQWSLARQSTGTAEVRDEGVSYSPASQGTVFTAEVSTTGNVPTVSTVHLYAAGQLIGTRSVTERPGAWTKIEIPLNSKSSVATSLVLRRSNGSVLGLKTKLNARRRPSAATLTGITLNSRGERVAIAAVVVVLFLGMFGLLNSVLMGLNAKEQIDESIID